MGGQRKVLVVFFAWVGLLLVPGLASAQTTSGTIAGVVKDTTGAVLPGVTVEASSPALIERVRAVVSDDKGEYKIVDLRPGTYVVTFSLAGFSTVKREGLELNTGFTATVNAELKVGNIEETLTVSGAAPVVDVQDVRGQNVLTRALLDAVPTAKNFQGLAALTLGAITRGPLWSGDVGGSKGETIFGFNQIHGSPYGMTTEDGLKTTSSYSATTAYRIAFNQMDVQEVVMETSGTSAEVESGGLNVNMVPKDGGNIFVGSFNGIYTNGSLANSNLNDAMRARGLTRSDSLEHIYDAGVGQGGPIKKDKLWFYGALRAWGSKDDVAGVYYNATQDTLFYTPDMNRPGFYNRMVQDAGLRLTWQATSTQKITLSGNVQDYCSCYHTSFAGSASGFGNLAPEANHLLRIYPNNNFQATWSYPATTRLLFEAGGSLRADRQFDQVPGPTGDARSVLELSTGLNYGSGFTSGVAVSGTEYGDYGNQAAYQERFAVSYITGSHAFKVGFQNMSGHGGVQDANPLYDVQYIFNDQKPVQLKEGAFPYHEAEQMGWDGGLYGQDQWTIRRLTLNLGVRFDFLNANVPAQTRPASEFTPAINVAPVSNAPNWKDIDPRLGAAYDLRGNGKTAFKVSLGRYIIPQTLGIASDLNPAAAVVATTTRTWNDISGTYNPRNDCNLLNPAANGGCGAIANKNFGTPVVNTIYASDTTQGWDVRPYIWQGSVSVQQELRPGVGLTVGYFRLWYGNIWATNNLDVTAGDFTPYCITAPVDSRLPGGGGNQICGLYDVSPAKFGQVKNEVSLAPSDSDVYNGVDAGINARFGRGGMLSTGVSIGQTATSMCATTSVPTQFCKTTIPWAAQTQIKLSVAYPLAWGLQVSAVFQNLPGISIPATINATNAQIEPSLGRNLAACGAQTVCSATASVALFDPNAQRESRYTQLDVRLSKTIRVGRLSVHPTVDGYNLFNAVTPIGDVTTYGPSYLRPTELLTGRFVKFGARLDF